MKQLLEHWISLLKKDGIGSKQIVLREMIEYLDGETKIIWMTKEGNSLTANEISDYYMTNIINFVQRGGGHTSFMTLENIKSLLGEASKRGIKSSKSSEEIYELIQNKKDRLNKSDAKLTLNTFENMNELNGFKNG